MINKILLSTVVTTLTLYASCGEMTDTLEMGSCYEKEGNLNMAEAAYERLLFDDIDNDEAKLRLAALYRQEGMPKDADAVLTTVDEHQLTPQQRTTLATLRTQEPKRKGTFRAQGTLDLGYDDNININHIYDITTGASDPQGTRYLRFNADLSYQYDFSESNGWFLRSDANLYHQYNFDFDTLNSHYYDSLFGRLYAGGGYANRNLSIYVPLFYDRLNYLGVDLFTEIGARPDFNMMFNQMFVLNVNLLYAKRSYIQDVDKMRDDTILSLESGFYWIHGKNNAYAKLRYEQYSAKDPDAVPFGTKVFIDKTLINLTIGGLYSIKEIMDIRAQLLYRQGDFKEIPLFVGILKRDDTTQDFQLSFERDLTKVLRAHIQFHYLDNASNYNQAVFTKKEALVGLVYTY